MNRDTLATTTRIDILPDDTAQQATRNVSLSAGSDTEHVPLGSEDFQQLLDSVYDGTIVTNTDGTIREANGRACKFLGYTRTELIGASIVGMLYGSDSSLLDEIQTTLASDKFVLIQAACIRSDGKMFPAEISVNSVALKGKLYFCFFIRDITLRRETEDRLRTGHAAIQNAANGIGVADLEGNISYVNTAMEELWGLASPDTMLGWNISDFLCDEDTTETIITAVSRRLVWEHELTCKTVAGSTFHIRASVAPNLNADEEVTGMVLSLLDVTIQKQTAARLEATFSELKRSNEDLEQFAYAVSHDLQAPLRKITTFADIIDTDEGSQLSSSTEDALARMRNAASRMIQLIKGLLEYSRISTNEQPHCKVDLSDLVDTVLLDLETDIAQAGATVNVAPLPTITAEPVQMRQLFQNLIDNAIKFRRPDARPIVNVTSALLSQQDEPESEQYEIVVEDNGIGLPREQTERIFGVFQRLHSTKEYKGTGVGLALCRKIVERHGGQLTATPAEHHGARFRIVIPKQKETDNDRPTNSNSTG